jgi:hypothetical protein
MTKRINVTISEEMNDKLDKYGERYGMGKSSIVGFVLGQWMDNIERMNSAVYGATGNDGLIGELLKNMAKESQAVGNEEDKK